jgi:hypothetical protein
MTCISVQFNSVASGAWSERGGAGEGASRVHVESGEVEGRGLGTSWNLGQELESDGLRLVELTWRTAK